MKKFILFATLSIFASGCASMKESLVTGAAVGAAGGGILGNSHGTRSERHRNTNKGAAIGALIGAGIGYLAHKDEMKKKERERAKSKAEEMTPLLTRPKVKRMWVEDKVQGKRFIRGHWEYIIEEQSEWSR